MATSLSQPSFWILTALTTGRRHGYEILRATETDSGGAISLKVPTLYASLERLETDGLICVDGEEIVAGRARRYFVITEQGRARLEAEVEVLERSVRAARQHLAHPRLAFIGLRVTVA